MAIEYFYISLKVAPESLVIYTKEISLKTRLNELVNKGEWGILMEDTRGVSSCQIRNSQM